ncbi:MAG: hypothetical protein EON60_05905 [Alphaproteobacteria bacterium]|nr:MAG: hypothetical protein EON60_05905 [Alphaproteobacteria bacterium]
MLFARRTAIFASTCLAAGSVLLSACTTSPVSTTFPAPQVGDEGVIIAESAMVPGVTLASTMSGTTDDCAGPGLGITVEGSVNSQRFLFDKDGETCDPAQTLFDGRTAVNNRAADPSINLTFHDSFGVNPKDDLKNLPGLEPVPTIRLQSSELTPGQLAALEPAAGNAQLGNKAVPATPVPGAVAKGPDPLMLTLASWKNQDTVYAARSDEATAAAERNIDAISRNAQDRSEQENMAKLMATLRERERQVQEEQRRHQETLERAQKNRDVTLAARQQWQSKEGELQASLSATQQRLAQFEELSRRLAAEKDTKEKVYQQQLANLGADLKVAEAQADTSRRELVLKAAAKIAEAEQLASVAKLQEQEIKLREAARLKAEADTMMDRALAMKAGNSVVVGGMGLPPAVPMALMQTPVVLHANNQTLPDILAGILNQAAPQAGEWKADWQLSAPAQRLLKEKWSLTAEAPLQQVLAQLQQQVAAAHGVSLQFTQFGQSRLLVVTDATPPLTDTSNK